MATLTNTRLLKAKTCVTTLQLRWMLMVLGLCSVIVFGYLTRDSGLINKQINPLYGSERLRVNHLNRRDENNSTATCIVPEDCADPCDCVHQNKQSSNPKCRNDGAFLPYDEFLYCLMPKSLIPLSVLILMLWAAFLIYILVSTTEQYFLPALSLLSNKLHLSSNVAGITFLAIGNGAPDIIASLTATIHGSPTMGFSGILGGTVFVLTCVVGAISLASELTINRRPFIRDMVVMFIVVSVIFAMNLEQFIVLWEAIVLLLLYIFYVLGVVVGGLIYQRYKKKERDVIGLVEEIGEMDEEDEDDDGSEMVDVSGVAIGNYDDYDDGDIDEILLLSNMRSWDKSTQQGGNGRIDEGDASRKGWKCTPREYLQWCISSLAWPEKSLTEKVVFLLLAPLKLLQNATIPLLNEDSWSKLFGLLNFPCGLMLIVATFGWFTLSIKFGDVAIPVWPFVLAIGILISIIIFFTSSIYEPPKYYLMILLYGFLMSSIWMYLAATELVCTLRAVSQVLHLSDEIIGLSVIAWGNSVVDIVANIIIARNGFPSMAFSACLGAPIFNITIGVGLSALYVIIANKLNPYQMKLSNAMIASYATIAAALISIAVIVPICGFKSPSKFGIFLILIYFVFAVMAIVIELNVL